MKDNKHTLLQDTLHFFKESFDKKTSWSVSPNHPLLKKVLPPPLLKKETTPSFTREPIQPIALPRVIQENKIAEKIETPAPLEKKQEHKQEPSFSFSHLAAVMGRLFPQFALKEQPLHDKIPFLRVLTAQSLVFSFRESQESDLFLKNLHKAVQCYYGTAGLLDFTTCSSEKDLELFFQEAKISVIITSPAILQNKLLLPFIKELPATNERFLGKARLVVLEPFSKYFEHPIHKKTLWQTLCATLENTATQE